jgi:hypothetical protein
MSNVTVFDPSKIKAGIANMKKAAASRVGFLKMSKDGEWSYGSDDTIISPDDHVYIDPNGFVQGWQLWSRPPLDRAGKPTAAAELLDEVLVPMHEAMPAMPDKHPDPSKGGEWKALLGFSALLGDVKLTYSTTSYGGRAAFADLAEAFENQFAKAGGDKKPVAVVSLDSESYKHKTWGKIYNPVFNVVGWVAAPPKVEAEAEKPKLAAPAKKAAKRA